MARHRYGRLGRPLGLAGVRGGLNDFQLALPFGVAGHDLQPHEGAVVSEAERLVERVEEPVR